MDFLDEIPRNPKWEAEEIQNLEAENLQLQLEIKFGQIEHAKRMELPKRISRMHEDIVEILRNHGRMDLCRRVGKFKTGNLDLECFLKDRRAPSFQPRIRELEKEIHEYEEKIRNLHEMMEELYLMIHEAVTENPKYREIAGEEGMIFEEVDGKFIVRLAAPKASPSDEDIARFEDPCPLASQFDALFL